MSRHFNNYHNPWKPNDRFKGMAFNPYLHKCWKRSLLFSAPISTQAFYLKNFLVHQNLFKLLDHKIHLLFVDNERGGNPDGMAVAVINDQPEL